MQRVTEDDAPQHVQSEPVVRQTKDASTSVALRRTRSSQAIWRPDEDKRSSWRLVESFTASGGTGKIGEDGEGPDVARGCGNFLVLLLGATGVVFGDIGTSPLYTFSGIFVDVLGTENPTSTDVIDAFSMIFWMLTLVVTVKYIGLVMRVDHHGEGGTFAMMQRIIESCEKAGDPMGPKAKSSIALLAMLAVSLMAGDGCITPAISVLGALEGIPVDISVSLRVAIAVLILLAIFMMQRRGSQFIGLVAGPVTLIWFLTIAGLGLHSLLADLDTAAMVVRGLSPAAFVHFWTSGKYRGVAAWRSLAGVVLSVTGAEALYADMGHFGAGPISIAWSALVFPCLLLQYMGQAAALCARPHGVASPFFNAVPEPLKWPMVVLATLAAIVASQAMISGLFSLLSQAHAMKLLPRILVLHPNAKERGQVYIPEVNWILCFLCIAICVFFQSSTRLAGAYGIAVTSTFLVTTILLFVVARRVWHWHVLLLLSVFVPILVIDLGLWSANILKIVDSGWVPIVLSACLCFLMHTHLWGRSREEDIMAQEEIDEKDQMLRTGQIRDPSVLSTHTALQGVLRSSGLARTQKAAIFLTSYASRVPRTVGALAELLGCLPAVIVLLSIKFENVPFVPDEKRATFKAYGTGVFSVVLSFGYAEPLTVERVAVGKALSRVFLAHSREYPGLKMLDFDAVLGTDSCVAHCGADAVDRIAELEQGEAGDAQLTFQEEQVRRGLPTFVLHNLRYALKSGGGQRWFDRLRISLYSFMVLNARKPISYFGLEGHKTMEISVVRSL
eukprot:TRINITY_DN20535_c0_g1_i1.p1 TRINITY_DN20535_c0_g1~~TRINITY_DN20535_c0_g1_i1.p1  ORF type:complete len:786 (+),score=105.93 TRINITY_DN20535_c0_g1_i1:51-2408(+)